MLKVQNIAGLTPELTQGICAVLGRYSEVERATVFGSRALGTFRNNSDIDLCIDAPSMAFDQYLQLASELDELVMPYSLDLVLMHHVDNPDLVEHVQRVGKEVYARK